MDYLGIEFEIEALQRFSNVRLEGRMGDPIGTEKYQALSGEPVDVGVVDGEDHNLRLGETGTNLTRRVDAVH